LGAFSETALNTRQRTEIIHPRQVFLCTTITSALKVDLLDTLAPEVDVNFKFNIMSSPQNFAI